MIRDWQVVHVDKPHKGTPVIPKQDVNYHSSFSRDSWRTSMKPLNVVQPDGPSFSVRRPPSGFGLRVLVAFSCSVCCKAM